MGHWRRSGRQRPGRAAARITLGADQRAELEHQAAGYTRPHREVLRAKLVLLAEEYCSNAEIGERLGMSDGTGEALGKTLFEH